MGDLEFWVWGERGARENVRKRELTVRVRVRVRVRECVV